jgi:hypothetical protein
MYTYVYTHIYEQAWTLVLVVFYLGLAAWTTREARRVFGSLELETVVP